jgi:DNA-binding HxlR family transcriptional regulator
MSITERSPVAPEIGDDITCSIERSLLVLGERWSPLILRELHYGARRFADIRDRLGIASNLLSKRLKTLVDGGVVTTIPYREEGARARLEYSLTASGVEALIILGALQQWGDRHLPREVGPSVVRTRRGTGEELQVGFVTEGGTLVPLDDVRMRPTGR